jgi:hypothetical protein
MQKKIRVVHANRLELQAFQTVRETLMSSRGAAYQYFILSTAEITCANNDNGLQQAKLWSEAMTNIIIMYGAFVLQDSANERLEFPQTQMSTDINNIASFCS